MLNILSGNFNLCVGEEGPCVLREIPHMCRAKRKEKRALEYVKKQGDRLKACQKRAAVSRNDYLLALVTTNTHLRLHAEEYLPSVMKVGVVWSEQGVVWGERAWSG